MHHQASVMYVTYLITSGANMDKYTSSSRYPNPNPLSALLSLVLQKPTRSYSRMLTTKHAKMEYAQRRKVSSLYVHDLNQPWCHFAIQSYTSYRSILLTMHPLVSKTFVVYLTVRLSGTSRPMIKNTVFWLSVQRLTRQAGFARGGSLRLLHKQLVTDFSY
ncbi:hypothetical protein EDB19DRAFT_1152209 [Suillus lakei]|nr:hypothetical protein EDB19DRAFT_1152209 [Suillus lakei]